MSIPSTLDYPDLVQIDPQSLISLMRLSNIDSDLLSTLLAKEAEPRTSEGKWDVALDEKFEELDVYESIRKHFLENQPWEETRLYARVVLEMGKGQVKWGCKTPEQYLRRLKERIEPLYESMKEDGYLTQTELSSGKPSDEIRVAIDRKGELLFMDGRHRLAIAKILGIEKIPVKIILRHSEWVEFQEAIGRYADKDSRGKIYQTIEHPDLSFFPAHHADKRFEMLCDSLGEYDCGNKKLIDIGTHWGHMCVKFEELGFDCVAIEKLHSNIYYLRGIREAFGRSFEVWQGDIFDYPAIEEMDVVLALNILHHFCKTEPLHKRLIMLLKRMNAEIMFFQAHRHDPPGQMEGAFRNYSEEEFVSFIIEHTGLNCWEKLGVASDGRPLFKLWRE